MEIKTSHGVIVVSTGKMRVGEVTAPVIVVFHSHHLEVGKVNRKSATSSIDVLPFELLFKKIREREGKR